MCRHVAIKLVVPAVGVHEIAAVAIFTVAPRDVATLATQPYGVVAVVLVASEPVGNGVLRLIRGETTQLVESWYMVS